MNLTKLQRELEHLDVLLAIKGKRDEQEEEDALALALLALLYAVYDDEDYHTFMLAFMATLQSAYANLDTEGIYGDLIEQEISLQRNYLNGFINDLKAGRTSEAQDKVRIGQYASSLGKVRELFSLHSYDDDERLRWVMGENENHCDTCPTLHGKVKRAIEWQNLGLYPKCELTECNQACLCHFEIA